MENLIELIRQYRRARTEEAERRIVGEILKVVSPKLEGFLRRACHRPSVVDDLLQDTLLKLYKKLHQCRGRTSQEVMSWCYTVARNTLRSHFRSHKIEERMDPFDAETWWKVIAASGKKEPLTAAEWADLNSALDLLGKAKPPCRGYLWSRYVRELGYAEMGEIYRMTEDAARMQVQRCLKLAIELTKNL